MKKHMFHLACSPDSLPTSDAIKPLVVFLEDKIASEIDGRLLRENYHRCLHVIWESILLVLQENAEDPSNVRKYKSMLILIRSLMISIYTFKYTNQVTIMNFAGKDACLL